MTKSLHLMDFIMYFKLDTYIEIYCDCPISNNLVYEGSISKFIENKELSSKYAECKIEHEDVSIDPPGAVLIIYRRKNL